MVIRTNLTNKVDYRKPFYNTKYKPVKIHKWRVVPGDIYKGTRAEEPKAFFVPDSLLDIPNIRILNVPTIVGYGNMKPIEDVVRIGDDKEYAIHFYEGKNSRKDF